MGNCVLERCSPLMRFWWKINKGEHSSKNSPLHFYQYKTRYTDCTPLWHIVGIHKYWFRWATVRANEEYALRYGLPRQKRENFNPQTNTHTYIQIDLIRAGDHMTFVYDNIVSQKMVFAIFSIYLSKFYSFT